MSIFTGAAAIAAAVAAGTGSTLAASKMAGASKDAAQLSAEGTQAALDFTKAQKAKQEAAYAPYQQLGAQSLSGLAGAVRPSPTMGAPRPYTTQPMATQGQPMPMQGQPMSAMAQPQMGQGGGLVLVQAPTGETQRMSQQMAQMAVQRGAKIVG